MSRLPKSTRQVSRRNAGNGSLTPENHVRCQLQRLMELGAALDVRVSGMGEAITVHVPESVRMDVLKLIDVGLVADIEERKRLRLRQLADARKEVNDET